MGWKVRDFVCKDCGHEFETLYKEGEEVECPECDSTNTEAQFSPPQLGRYSMNSQEGRAEILKKRSADHTKKVAMKEFRDKRRG